MLAEVSVRLREDGVGGRIAGAEGVEGDRGPPPMVEEVEDVTEEREVIEAECSWCEPPGVRDSDRPWPPLTPRRRGFVGEPGCERGVPPIERAGEGGGAKEETEEPRE